MFDGRRGIQHLASLTPVLKKDSSASGQYCVIRRPHHPRRWTAACVTSLSSMIVIVDFGLSQLAGINHRCGLLICDADDWLFVAPRLGNGLSISTRATYIARGGYLSRISRGK